MVLLSIIMPCFKGEKFIEKSIHEVENVISRFCKEFEIIVVIDGFVDNSYEIAKSLEKTYKNLLVTGYESNRGKGFAIEHALNFANGEYVALLDSDLDYRPEVIESFLKICEEENADIVIGNRRARESVVKYSRIRKILSIGFNLYVNTLFPELNLQDTQVGIKLFRREVIKRLFSELKNYAYKGYAFDVCLLVLARRLKYKIVEAPCIFTHRHTEIKKIGMIKTIYKMGIDVLKLKMKIGDFK